MTFYILSVIISFFILGGAHLWAKIKYRDNTSLRDLFTLSVVMLIPFLNIALSLFIVYGFLTSERSKNG